MDFRLGAYLAFFAFVVSSSVRILIVQRYETRVIKCIAAISTTATTVGKGLGTVYKELLAEVKELSFADRPVSLYGTRRSERPARAAGVSLALHRRAKACFITPVECRRNL